MVVRALIWFQLNYMYMYCMHACVCASLQKVLAILHIFDTPILLAAGSLGCQIIHKLGACWVRGGEWKGIQMRVQGGG